MLKYSVVDEAGYIRLPEWIREKLGLKELDKVEFIEKDGGIVIKKIEPLPWEEIEEMLKKVREDFRKDGYTEEQMLKDLQEIRKQMWEENKHKYEHLLKKETPSRKDSPPERPWDKNRAAARVGNHAYIMRKEYGWSRKDLARKLGTTEEVIRRIEEVDYITEDE